MSSSDRRVVITGMGLISPLGNSPAALWEAIAAGRSGVGPLERVPAEPLQADIAGEARAFTGHIDDFGPLDKQTQRAIKKGLKLMCREIQMGVAASQLALTDAGLTPGAIDPNRIGTMFGSDYIITEPHEFATGVQHCLDGDRKFQFEKWGHEGLPRVEPLWLLKYLPNMPASHVAIYNDLRGPSNSITVREASANLALAEAVIMIRRGVADAMVAGATGSRITTLRSIHVSMQERLADRHAPPADGDPTRACRPYERHASGIVMGEGAGILILEALETAEARGAKILGEIVGYGSAAAVDPDGKGQLETAVDNVVRATLQNTGLQPADFGHIHGHGTGDPAIDRAEAVALNRIFGDQMPVTAVKSYMGSLGAGSGVVEVIASLCGLHEGVVPPVLNHDETDPECPIRVLDQPLADPGPLFLSLNVTPQGQASAVAVRKW